MGIVLGRIAQAYGKTLEVRIIKSAAGYYIGTLHPDYGPVSRESEEYFAVFEDAERALLRGAWTQRKSA